MLCFSAGPPLSSACLDATTIPHASGAWSRIFHLMHGLCLGSLPWPLCLACAVCVAATLSRLLCVLCPWCLGCLTCWCPGRCAVWVGCVPGVLASWPTLCGWAAYAPVRGPALWAVWLGLIFRPFIAAFLEGLLKRPLFSPCIFPEFLALIFRPCVRGFIFSGLFFRLREVEFFLRIFLRRNFRRIFPDLFFRIFSCPIFATVSGFLFFLDVIFVRFPVFRDELFHVVKFQKLVHGSLVDSVALTF